MAEEEWDGAWGPEHDQTHCFGDPSALASLHHQLHQEWPHKPPWASAAGEAPSRCGRDPRSTSDRSARCRRPFSPHEWPVIFREEAEAVPLFQLFPRLRVGEKVEAGGA